VGKDGETCKEEEMYNSEERKRSTRTGYNRIHLLTMGSLHTKKGGNRKTLRDVVKTFDKDNEGTANRSWTEIEERERAGEVKP